MVVNAIILFAINNWCPCTFQLSDFQEGGSQYTTTESYVKKNGTKIALTNTDDSKKKTI